MDSVQYERKTKGSKPQGVLLWMWRISSHNIWVLLKDQSRRGPRLNCFIFLSLTFSPFLMSLFLPPAGLHWCLLMERQGLSEIVYKTYRDHSLGLLSFHVHMITYLWPVLTPSFFSFFFLNSKNHRFCLFLCVSTLNGRNKKLAAN